MEPTRMAPVPVGPVMVRVATAGDAFEARVIAARLGADGIVWELRGGVDGPYPVGVVDVLVEAAEAEAARELLSLTEEAGDVDDADDLDDGAIATGGRCRAVAVLALVVAALLGLARIVALL